MNYVHFYKYQATGNDFILFDNRHRNYNPSIEWISKICHRKWGVGADGLIFINHHLNADFEMVYYNKDGTKSLCGNGCRVAVDLASHLKIIDKETSFVAFDGYHQASVLNNHYINLQMNDVNRLEHKNKDLFVFTGSPHYIRFVTHLNQYPVLEEGKKIRYSKLLSPEGANVNFVELSSNNKIFIRTYERGVETETLSCGTGAVAAALAASLHGYNSPIIVQVKGGELSVQFKPSVNQAFSCIFLTGPVTMVFEGDIEL